MLDFKYLFGMFGIIFSFIGYIPYIRDTIYNRTKPHLYSWFLWALISIVLFILQVTSGGGMGSFVTLVSGILCLTVFILGLKNGKSDISASDKIVSVVCFIAIVIWFFANDPDLSNYLLVGINILIILPTIRKSWQKPYSETISMWIVASLCNAFAIISLENYSILTALYPAYCTIVNLLFAILLILRRSKIEKTNALDISTVNSG